MNPVVFEKVRGIKCIEHRICYAPGYVLTYGEGVVPYIEPAFCTCVKREEIEIIEIEIEIEEGSDSNGSSNGSKTNTNTDTTNTDTTNTDTTNTDTTNTNTTNTNTTTKNRRPDIHGVAFLITRQQYEHMLLTEGGWGYQEYKNDPFWGIGHYGVQEIDCIEIASCSSSKSRSRSSSSSTGSAEISSCAEINSTANGTNSSTNDGNATVDENKNTSTNEQQQQHQETVDTHNNNRTTATADCNTAATNKTTTTTNSNLQQQHNDKHSFKALTLVGLMGSRKRYDCNASQRYCDLVWVGAESSGLPGLYRKYLRDFHPPYSISSGNNNNDNDNDNDNDSYRSTWGVVVAKYLFLVFIIPCLFVEIASVQLCVKWNDRVLKSSSKSATSSKSTTSRERNGGGGKRITNRTNSSDNNRTNNRTNTTIDTNRKWVLFRPPWILMKAIYLYRRWVLEHVLQTLVFDWLGIPCGFRNNNNDNGHTINSNNGNSSNDNTVATTVNGNGNRHGTKEE